ncbi:hypothetical protein ACFSKU_10150 [Pontibacter silvestris]|uniref:Uncharacterized protein n=1 Tax=Pontibacter silvestris TaxID=2305183 RepID=A0ABW4WZV7_9BACT|nr:hypothetical protein [Pontibacter silvestris]MCC9136800.1 hypothetical protein [Pontibacter silvestris]
MKIHIVALLLLCLLSCNNSSKHEQSDQQLAGLFSSTEASEKPTPVPDANGRVTGEIPYRPYWAYHNDKSRQDLDAFFDGELDENPNFGPDGNSQVTPSEMWFPFPEEMEATLKEIQFYDWQGKNQVPIKTYFIERDSWKRIPGPAFTGNEYDTWVPHQLKKPLDIAYVVLEVTSRVFPTEIRFIGSYKPYNPKPFTHKEVSINDMLGVNTYVWDFQKPSGRGNDMQKFNVAAPFTTIRDYVDWEKIEHEQGIYTFNPVFKGLWHYDAYYAELKKRNIEPLVCFKTVPGWFLQANYPEKLRHPENPPARWTNLPSPEKPDKKDYKNQDAYKAALAKYEQKKAAYDADLAAIRLDPASYTEFAKAAFQFVARYGSNKNLDPDLVKPFSGNGNSKFSWNIQDKKIGLGYVKMIECNNETNAWWKGRMRYQTAREYAANLSAFYDGHMGKLGKGVGVKNADPAILVAMGGIADNSPAYVQGIIDWCKEFRGYKTDKDGKKVVNLCFDIANYHGYTNNGGGQYSDAANGIPPELSDAKDQVQKFLQVMSEVGNDVPVYLTEVGYGVNEGSQQALETPSRTRLQTQGDWIIRDCLFYARMGLAKLYHYQLYDETSYTRNIQKGKKDNRTYAALGLLEKMDNTRRPAADYIAQLGNKFGEYTYRKTISTTPFVDVYEHGGKKMYALVVPDMEGRTEEYELDLGTAKTATIYEFVDGAEHFKERKVKTANGKLKLKVTESPIFVDAV